MSRTPRTQEQLQRASLTIQQELATLATTHELIQELSATWGSSPRVQALSTALLHTFLFSARSLLSFLYAHNPRNSDIIAEDFFDDPEEWRRGRVVPEPEMQDGTLRDMISKRLAHLTWDRTGTDRPLWGAFKITWNIAQALKSFVKLADDDKLHSSLHEDLNAMLARLEATANQWGGVEAAMAPCMESTEFDELEYYRRLGD